MFEVFSKVGCAALDKKKALKIHSFIVGGRKYRPGLDLHMVLGDMNTVYSDSNGIVYIHRIPGTDKEES
jgi:hypothetical protein